MTMKAETKQSLMLCAMRVQHKALFCRGFAKGKFPFAADC